MYRQSHRTNSDVLNLLKQEVELLRSLVISTVGKDKEGEYKSEFIRRILKSTKSKPKHIYKDSKTFLSQLGVLK
ncbi:MAG: hypothetical protein A2734_01265 [Parcubacteria group bacterium RIFCSPHIGHO2_01_FULL_40_30]|nr:MAG: hypothetical protein A2734_01265 [Parcubacteria group bacterium RIFCSPHIGHO2_01_FULL_40_30]OHB23639.1 MAG: hypothetical protein A3I22_01135 [Parcubacteria group bacterium RIFCSPLOWO2_02_FULL_40_12]OHB24261.1 MAG: hypothetical protein A3F96_00105 [Parcubacteria group bacterium RIFCSPLOWO2_12_FULL_40_10]